MIKSAHLDFWIQNNYNVLFVGRAGVGKTSIIKYAFEKAGLNWKYFSASTMDPWVDFVGVPREKTDENGNTYLDLIRPKEFQDDTIEALFFDEYNRSPKKIRNAVMELIQFKSINGKKFNNLKVVWAAINPSDSEEETYDVEPLDPAQEDRFHIKVEIPYSPDLKYFSDRFGKQNAKAAIEWWKNLPSKIQNQVSPRRLDYALDIHAKSGDLSYVLPTGSNIGKLIQGLASGPMLDRLQEIIKAGDKAAAAAFIKIENNYSSAIDFILKDRNFFEFFIPLMEMEKISSLLASESKKNQKSLIEFVISESKNNPMFKKTIEEILKSKSNYSLNKKIIDEIRIKNLKDEFGLTKPKDTSNTYYRMKKLKEIAKIIPSISNDTDCEKQLREIDEIIKHTQDYTLRYNPFITKTIKSCINKLSYKGDMSKICKLCPNVFHKVKL